MAETAKTLKAKMTAAQIEKRQIELSGSIDVESRIAKIDLYLDTLLDLYSALLVPA